MADARYDALVYATTHNSYSPGRGSLVRQLDDGVRGFELDVNRSAAGRYEIGHDAPGREVAHGAGNPDGDDLGDWLHVIASWSAAHERHAPITIMLDAKEALTDAPSFALGNPAALNAALRAAFGDRLLTPVELGDRPWPRLSELRGRVVVVLSGDRDGRAGYLRDGGRQPAVATNDAAAVVEVHASSSKKLWYWTGRHEPDGRVTWARHGRCDGASGTRPSVALNDDGGLVVVAGGAGGTTLRGRLDDDSLEIDWEPGGEPVTAAEIDGDAHPTVRVASIVQDGLPETLVYATDAVSEERIRYEQVAFVEGQWTAFDRADAPPAIPLAQLRFLAIPAGSAKHARWIAAHRRPGQLVRLWDFVDSGGDLLVNFPATDEPRSERYRSYLEGRPVAR